MGNQAVKFKEIYEGVWEIDPRLKELHKHLKEARTGYYCALAAVPFMPIGSKPYTRQTAQRYFDKIKELKKAIKELENG